MYFYIHWFPNHLRHYKSVIRSVDYTRRWAYFCDIYSFTDKICIHTFSIIYVCEFINLITNRELSDLFLLKHS